jgi:hypothetical protein
MKTKITLVTLFAMVALAANAQFPPYYFGLKAAPQISWMKPNADTYESSGVKAGFSWGFIAEFNFTENHCIATGFNMIFNGGKLKFPALQGEETGTMIRDYALKYIEIPLTLKMRTNDINNMRYFGRIGLGTAFNIGSKKTDEFTNSDGEKTTFPKANYDKTSFARESLIIGAGVEYEIAEGPKLGAEITFNNGFTNILQEKNSVNTSLQEKATPNFIELALSVIF